MAEEKEYPTCQKLSDHEKEWNAIFPFMEWLIHERRVVLCKYETLEEAKARGAFKFKDGSYSIHEDPNPIGKSIKDLLYEYLEVDPSKLEQERRVLLDKLREMNKK